jgi:hypothetical protein
MLDVEMNPIDHKSNVAIHRLIDENLELHSKLHKLIRMKRQKRKSERDLNLATTRGLITAERDSISKLQQAIAEANAHLGRAEILRASRIGKLEEEWHALVETVDAAAEEQRVIRTDFALKVSDTEHQVSGLSTKFARENETWAAETKSFMRTEDKIARNTRSYAEDLQSLGDRVQQCRMRYNDAKLLFTAAWQVAHDDGTETSGKLTRRSRKARKAGRRRNGSTGRRSGMTSASLSAAPSMVSQGIVGVEAPDYRFDTEPPNLIQ